MTTKEQIIERINQIEKNQDYLSYKDRWNTEDYANNRAWTKELVALRKELSQM